MTVLAILAGLIGTAPAHAAATDVRPAAQPYNCQGYTSGPTAVSHVSLVGFATTNCWNVDRWTTTWARGAMWRWNPYAGSWVWIGGGGDAWGNYRAEARVQGSGTCGAWYKMTGEHSMNGQYWTSEGAPIFWPCL